MSILKEQNKFRVEDVKTVASDLYENKPTFYGVLSGVGTFLITSADLTSSIGIGTIVSIGYKIYKSIK